VSMRGIRLTEPCNYLEGLTKDGVRNALEHRAGLNAEILNDGTLRTGDTIKEI